jgi:AAA15 family ATPase/GTPase
VGSSVLLNFRVTNFRSIKETAELKLTRSAREEVAGFPYPDVVPALAVLGANGAGKSNLFRAISTMFSFIRTSATRVEERLPYTPYMLGGSSGEPTTFQVVVLLDDVRYEYGYSFDAERVRSEWLRSWPRGRQRNLFVRDVDEDDPWVFGDSLTGANQTLAKATRPDALLLSTARVLNHDLLGPLQQALGALVRSVGSGDSFGPMLQLTLEGMVNDRERYDQVRQLVVAADLGIADVTIEEEQVTEQFRETTRRLIEAFNPNLTAEQLSAELARAPLQATMSHKGVEGSVEFPFQWESTGTRNFFVLLGPILDRLARGGVLIVDEIDASLHPRLVSEVVRFFQDPRRNPRQAQLLLSTHDVTVMMNVGDYNVLERDQLWFMDKTDKGASVLTPLTTFNARRGEVFSRNYLLERYGGVPRIRRREFDIGLTEGPDEPDDSAAT